MILALSGRKQSGKNTAFNFLLGIELLKLSVVRQNIKITPKGKLWISDIFGSNSYEGIFDIDRNNDTMRDFREEYIYPFIRNYSFADCLKQDICMNLLGLTYEQCYGTDEQKNALTHLKWEDMPGVLAEKEGPKDKKLWGELREVRGRLGKYYDEIVGNKLIYHEPGPMTAREVMQFVGTEIFRRMYSQVWAEGTIKKIVQNESKMSIITDCRFPNEVEVTKRAGGKVIRFTRGQDSTDVHESETALDPDNYDWSNFDAVIDNADMSISEQNEETYKVLDQWGWVDQINLPEPSEI